MNLWLDHFFVPLIASAGTFTLMLIILWIAFQTINIDNKKQHIFQKPLLKMYEIKVDN